MAYSTVPPNNSANLAGAAFPCPTRNFEKGLLEVVMDETLGVGEGAFHLAVDDALLLEGRLSARQLVAPSGNKKVDNRTSEYMRREQPPVV